MNTLYFSILTVLGGLLAIFFASGWSSYKYKKIPERPILFRWFMAGVAGVGLAAYTWIFGYGGNVSEVMETIGGALEVGELASEKRSRAGTETITVGLAPF